MILNQSILKPCYEWKNNLNRVLLESIDIASSLSENIIVDMLNQVNKTLDNTMFNIYVVGDYGTGKSSLLNALFGEKVLPQTFIPKYLLPVTIKYGERSEASIYYHRYLTSDQFNALPTKAAERILENGTKENQQLICNFDEIEDYLKFLLPEDLDQTFLYECLELRLPFASIKNNVEVILLGLSDDCYHPFPVHSFDSGDIVVMVMDATRCCTSTEMEFVEQKLENREDVGKIFVINRWDQIGEKEGSLMHDFISKKLHNCLSKQIIHTSAFDALKGIEENNGKLYEHSNIEELIQVLSYFVRERMISEYSKVTSDMKSILEKINKVIEMHKMKLSAKDDKVGNIIKELCSVEYEMNEITNSISFKFT